MKEDYQKPFKQSTLFFLLNPIPFNEQSYQKQKLPGTSAQSLFRLQNKFRKILIYILSDQVWWCNVKQLLSYFKNCICKFVQANSWHHKLFHFHLSFVSGKSGKKGKKLQKFEYLENKKNFFEEIKNTSHFSVGRRQNP